MVLLEESASWEVEWSEKVFEVIAKFEDKYKCIMEQSSMRGKQKRK
jgi:hypothetical protein